VGEQTSISIALQQNSADLASVVVIGYGTARKRDLTGSIGRVSAQDVNAYPVTNVLQSLQGRAAGVMVSQNNGAPGASVSVRIRGTNSILGSNEPLYVIDGFPYSGNPTFLQNSDIQSIEILKDASSVAIYGSRGANGVVLITTKSGRKGKTTVDVETAYSIQSVSKKMQLMNAVQYAEFYNEQAANDNLAPFFTQAQLDEFAKSPGTDWQSLVMHKAPLSTTSVTVNGGSDKTQFSVSGGVFRQNGIIRKSDYNRYSLRANLTHDLGKIFNLSYNATLTRIDSRRQNSGRGNRGGDLISAMLNAPPTVTPYKEDGSYRRLNTVYPFISNVIVNPLSIFNEISDRIKADRILANAALTIKPATGLSIRISGGVENSNDRTDYYENIDSTRSSIGSASVGTTQLTSFLNENVVNYTKRIQDHSISAMAGFTYQDYVNTYLSGSGSGFLSDVTGTYNLQGAATAGIPSSGYTKWVLLSYIGRLNYGFKEKYLATISFRRDGSSRYSENNKWGNFPSAAIAWRISDEPFFAPVKFISDLKVRASYGSTGSTAISPYQTLNQLSSSKTIFGDALYNAMAPGTVLPGDLKWETTDQWDIGLDAAFANNRIRVTADYYQKRTRNLLNNVQLPASMGYISTVRNVGEIQNKGIEIGVDADVLKGPVQWTLTTNFSMNRNKVLKLYGGQDIFGTTFYTGSLSDYVNLLREGQPLGIFYGYVEKGYTANGLLDYEDLNKDGKISAADKTYIGNPNADFIYSVNSIASWKGFELTVFLQGSQGNDIFNLNASQTLDLGMGLNLPQEIYNNHWTPSNTNTKYAKVTRTLNGNMSSRLVEDGSYLRFKNIQLAYSLPVADMRTPWLRSAQVYVSAQNMITITGYSWYDPDVNAYGGSNSINQGIDYLSYPNSKSVTIGIRCGF
jgi:TonB-linked SusC/RagA family outer membrane protein